MTPTLENEIRMEDYLLYQPCKSCRFIDLNIGSSKESKDTYIVHCKNRPHCEHVIDVCDTIAAAALNEKFNKQPAVKPQSPFKKGDKK